ncbi:MAG: VanW family protein [Candidatus Gracilibacteria bacterium]
MSKPLNRTLYAVALGIGLGLVMAALIAGLKFSLHGKLPPGTIIANIDLGYETIEKAKFILKEKEEKFLSSPLKFSLVLDDSKLATEAKAIEAEILPQDIGIEFDLDETLKTINKIDLKQNSLPHELQRAQKSIEVLYAFDTDKLIEEIEKKFSLKEIAPQNATYFFNEKSVLDIKEEKAGKLVDFTSAIQEIKAAIAVMEPVEIPLRAISAPASVTKEDLTNLKEEITRKLNNKIIMVHDEGDWVFQPIKHLDWIEFAETNVVTLPYINLLVEIENKYLPQQTPQQAPEAPIPTKIKILISLDRLNEYIDTEMAEYIEIAVDPISIYTDANTSGTGDTGAIIINGKGRDGIAIQRETLKKSLELALENSVDKVQIETKTIIAPVTISKELQDMGIKELIGVGHTNFSGSPKNRIYNIGVGVDHFNGMLIAPDEEFSFNTTLGRVDASTGYKEELVITKIGTVPEYGGGLCQVSTTMYGAAVFTGLPITERAPHSYAVSYYSSVTGHGLDATIYLGGQDLKYINDTPGHILINSYAEGNDAYFKFYGTSDGRVVKLDGPTLSNYKYPLAEVIYEVSNDLAPGETKQVERKHTGFDALWYRTITYPDGEEKVEEIFSHYKATQEKYLKGPEV